MKFRTTPAFDTDWSALSAEGRELARKGMAAFIEACNAAERDGHWPPTFPAKCRVSQMKGVDRIWEMTRHYRQPGGRATFAWVSIDGKPGVLWRRLGGHEIYERP